MTPTLKTGSDIDLVGIYNEMSDVIDARQKLKDFSISKFIPCDLLLCDTSQFERHRNLGGPYFMAEHHGVELYGQATEV